MKLFRLGILVSGLKAVLALLVICFLCFFTAATKAKEAADDVWKQLGLTLPEADNNINQSFIKGRFLYNGAKNAKNIALGDRVAVVKELVAHAKKSWDSQEFQTAYKNYWTPQYNRTKANTQSRVDFRQIQLKR